MAEEIKEQIREAALRLLDRQDYTVAEIRRKLVRKSYALDEVDEVLAGLEECNLLDDSRYAFLYTESKLHSGKGRMYISSKLKEKGVDEDIIKDALENHAGKDVEKLYCLKKALSICGLSQRFTISDDGQIVPSDGAASALGMSVMSGDADEVALEERVTEVSGKEAALNETSTYAECVMPENFEEIGYEKVNYFEPDDEVIASDRALAYKYREKAKAKLARRLISAGYSAGMAFDAVKKISEL